MIKHHVDTEEAFNVHIKYTVKCLRGYISNFSKINVTSNYKKVYILCGNATEVIESSREANFLLVVAPPVLTRSCFSKLYRR